MLELVEEPLAALEVGRCQVGRDGELLQEPRVVPVAELAFGDDRGPQDLADAWGVDKEHVGLPRQESARNGGPGGRSQLAVIGHGSRVMTN